MSVCSGWLRILYPAVALTLVACAGQTQWRLSDPDARGDVEVPACVLRPNGYLSIEQQRESLDPKLPAIDACLGPGSDRVTVGLVVALDGSVERVRDVEGAPLEGGRAGCVADAIRAVHFPSPGCDGSLEVRWQFRPGAPPEPIFEPSTQSDVELVEQKERIGLDKEAIGSVVRSHGDQLRLCYERRLQSAEELEGRVAARFVIDAEGRVAWVALTRDTVPDPAVGRCIVGALRGWRFPRPLGGVTVVVDTPWVFRPR